jgi:hypothetical protein
MGKLWQAVSWRDDELQSAKQHQTASGLWLLGEEDLILLLVAILFLSNGAKLQIPIHNGLKNFLTLTIKHGRSIHSGSASSGILKHTIPLDPITKCQQTGNQNNQWLDCVPPDLLLFYICDHLALVLGDDDVGSSTDDSQLFLWYLQNWSTQNFDVQSNNQNNFCF